MTKTYIPTTIHSVRTAMDAKPNTTLNAINTGVRISFGVSLISTEGIGADVDEVGVADVEEVNEVEDMGMGVVDKEVRVGMVDVKEVEEVRV